MRSPLLAAAFLLLPPILGGCAGFHFPYRIDVQQGNVVSQEMLEKLKPGMNPQEVRHVMGSPLLVDPFHPQRWDYYYSLRRAGETLQQRRITLFFQNERLVRVEGDVKPGG